MFTPNPKFWTQNKFIPTWRKPKDIYAKNLSLSLEIGKYLAVQHFEIYTNRAVFGESFDKNILFLFDSFF